MSSGTFALGQCVDFHNLVLGSGARGQGSLTLKAITTRQLFMAHNEVSLGFQRHLRQENYNDWLLLLGTS